MTELLQPVIELLIFIPGMLLAYLPMKQNLRLRPGRLAAAMVPFILLLCLGGGLLWHSLPVKAKWIYLPAAAIAGLVYIRTLQISLWKSVSVFLAVCGVFSCLGSLAKILDFILRPENTAPWISTEAGLLDNLFCWAFVFLAWYPATHAARSLLEDDAFAQTWFVFWILPILFIALNLFITPIHPELMNQGRIIQIYIVVILALLFLLLMFYFMFYLMAASLNRNHRLRQENQFLSMQQMQYDSLRSAIAETREARHDMRHHFDTLMSLAQKGEWEKLESYLADARGAILGLTRGAGRAHIVRAALESIAYQVCDLARAMAEDARMPLSVLNVDGGAAANDFLMQFQADMLGAPLRRPDNAETTALGAAYLAGLSTGFWKSTEELAALREGEDRFLPTFDEPMRAARLAAWHEAVSRVRS